MIKLSKLLIIFFCFCFSFSFSFTSYASENDKFIAITLSNINKLLVENKFEKGTIYLQNDSIVANLMLFKKREKVNTYLLCIAKLDNDSIKVFTAKDIVGYRLLNDIYTKYSSSGDDFFIKKVRSGKADLYEKIELPSDNKLLFYLKLPGYDNLFVINPSENNISETHMPGKRANAPDYTYYSSKGIHQKFKIFVSTYLGDCQRLKNLVETEYYTINNIPTIIDIYNNCF